MTLKLSGVVPPVVTPMLTDDQLDIAAVDRIVEHLITGGVSGLFVLGTTGEGPSLNYQMRYEMVERTRETAGERVPVLVGVTDTSFSESLALAQHSANCGAAAIVAAAPFYFDVSQRDLERWFTRLADESILPVMLYNMPSCVGVNLEPDTVARLSVHPNIAGIKDSSGDLSYFRELCRTYGNQEDFLIFMGPEELLAEAVEAGADGGVCGGANLLPSVYSRLYDAAVRSDSAETAYWKSVIDDVFQSVYRDPSGRMKLIPALKLAMEDCGLCRSTIAPPLPDICDAHAEQIRAALPRLLAACEYSTQR